MSRLRVTDPDDENISCEERVVVGYPGYKHAFFFTAQERFDEITLDDRVDDMCRWCERNCSSPWRCDMMWLGSDSRVLGFAFMDADDAFMFTMSCAL